MTHTQIASGIPDVAVDAVRTSGWALVPAYLSGPELAALLQEAKALAEKAPSQTGCNYFFDRVASGEERLARVERIANALASVRDGSLGRRMQKDAERCFGTAAAPFKEKMNIRYPGSPGYAPHQDAARWDRYGARFLSFGLFLSPSDASRGGFEISTQPAPSGRLANSGGDLDVSLYTALPRVELRANAGDALLIDGDVPHCTTANRSDDAILHLLFTYVSGTDTSGRAAYYASQAQDFERARTSPNVFVFQART